MNPSFRGGLLFGFIVGAAGMALVFLLLRPRPVPSAPPPTPVEVNITASLREENRRLQQKMAEMEKSKPVAPEVVKKEAKPAAVEKPVPEIRELFAKLSEAGLGAFRSPKFAETLETVKSSGKPAMEFLMNILRTSSSATERFMAAALMEGAGDPTAVESLAFALKADKDDMVRRMASHGLAVIGAPAAEAPLRAATVDDTDWGVRVNSAYGLAKLQKEDGLRILRDAYESSETPAEYRLAILGGLADVAAPSTAPLFRRILSDTKDASYLLMSIGALEKMKDVESINALQQVVNSTQPEMVKQAATRAIESIRK